MYVKLIINALLANERVLLKDLFRKKFAALTEKNCKQNLYTKPTIYLARTLLVYFLQEIQFVT